MGFIAILIMILLGLVVLGMVNSQSIQNGSLVHTDEWQGSFLTINGNKIRFIQKGSGADVLLIHGTPGTIEDWQLMIDSLSKNYRVTAYDRYGNGFSTAKKYAYTIDENAALASSVIDALKLDSIVLVGHSYGGATSAQLAIMKNDKIKSFVIVAAPLLPFKVALDYTLMSMPILGKGLTVIGSKTLASFMVKKGLETTFGTNGHLLTDDFVQTRQDLWSQAKVLYTTSNERRNYNEGLSKNAPRYKTITQKITFLAGENDAAHIVRDFHQLEKELPNAEFIFLKNTAHFIQFEAADKLLEVITEHLE